MKNEKKVYAKKFSTFNLKHKKSSLTAITLTLLKIIV